MNERCRTPADTTKYDSDASPHRFTSRVHRFCFFSGRFCRPYPHFVQDLIRKLLTVDPDARITASEACEHPWLTTARPKLSSNNLSAGLELLKIFNAKRKFRVAIKSVSKPHARVHVRVGRLPHA